MNEECIRRWRMIVGKDCENCDSFLHTNDFRIDKSLETIYFDKTQNKGNLSPSAPYICKWLSEIRSIFPQDVVSILQKDAINKLNLKELLTEKEMLEHVVPDINLAATLLSLNKAIPEENKEAVRKVVSKVVEELMNKFLFPTINSMRGVLNRSTRQMRPKFREINWNATIKKNLQNYQSNLNSIIIEKLIGYGHKRNQFKEIIVCIDQSGSMATSIIYSAVFGAILSSIPSIKTRLVVFDTEVVDLSDYLNNPVDLLFGVRLGGGTDIYKALLYSNSVISNRNDTILFVLTDLFDGGNLNKSLSMFVKIKDSGVKTIVLTSLCDDGSPNYNREAAQYLINEDIPTFACTPNLFPDVVASAINNNDMTEWASKNLYF